MFDPFLLVLAILAAILWFAWCNYRTFRFRGEIVDRASAMADVDISAGRDWRHRYEPLRRVTYDQTLLRMVFLLNYKKQFPEWMTKK